MRPTALLLAAALVAPAVAVAQATPEPAPTSPPPSATPDTAAPADQPSPEDLKAIEEALKADAKNQPAAAQPSTSPGPSEQSGGVAGAIQSLNPDMSVTLDVAGAAFRGEPLQTGGHDPQHNGFNLQQLELTLGSSVDPYFRFDANLVFGPDGFEIEEAYATTTDLPWNLQVRAGQFLTRFGRLNSTHPHAWDFVDQPFALGRVFGGDGNRAPGLEASWLAPLPWYVELVGSASDAAGESTARSFYGDKDLGVKKPTDLLFTGALKQFFPLTDALSVLWGLSAMTGPNSTGPDERTGVFGSDLYLRYRSLEPGSFTTLAWQTEALYRRRGTPDGRLDDVGGYTQLFWRMFQRWGTAVRYEYGTPARAVGAVAADPLDPYWTDARHRVSANVTFWPTEFSRLRLQGSTDVRGWDKPPAGEALPAGTHSPAFALFLALEVNVGVHGAHQF